MCGFTETRRLGEWFTWPTLPGRYLIITPVDNPRSLKFFRIADGENHRFVIQRMKKYGWKLQACVNIRFDNGRGVQPSIRQLLSECRDSIRDAVAATKRNDTGSRFVKYQEGRVYYM